MQIFPLLPPSKTPSANTFGCNKYVKYWFQEIAGQSDAYHEPFLDEFTTEFIKFACDTMKQDTHVFIMAIEILELYIRKKNDQNVKIADPTLAIACVIFLCSKFVGEQSDLRAKNIETFLAMSSQLDCTASEIKNVEFDIFKTLGGKLPLYCKLDDLNTFLEIYLQPMRLRVDLRPLCVRLLAMVYVSRQTLFGRLLKIYQQNDEAFLTFKHLIQNKLYFPAGILMCAFNVSNYKNFLDMPLIAVDLSFVANIHQDHLTYLCNCIHELVFTTSV